MVLTPDEIGHIAEVATDKDFSTPIQDGQRVLFRTTHLGDKYRTFDFLVSILGPDHVPQGIFFVQVKGTTRATAASVRVPIAVGADEFNRLVAAPVPTYLVGVDVNRRATYIVAAHRRRGSRVSSITRAFPLGSDAVKVALHDEVAEYWKANGRTLWNTRFRDV
ncbi:MAG TPA: DUF4365 domain-containing protein [Longimicrobium sp.]